MDVYKEQSTGLFICKICNNAYNSLQLAMECANAHPKEPKEVPIVPETQNTMGPGNSEVQEYRNMIADMGTVKLAEKLCMSLIEDYLISRQRDMQEKNRVSAMTLSLGKIAAEALINLNKVTSVGKNVNINVDGGKKTDVSALRELMEGKQRDNIEKNDEDM